MCRLCDTRLVMYMRGKKLKWARHVIGMFDNRMPKRIMKGSVGVFDNSPIERVEEFKYLGTTLTNQNSIQEEIKSGLKSGNACYYSVQNLLSSSLLSKKLKIEIYRTKFCLLSCMGVKLGR